MITKYRIQYECTRRFKEVLEPEDHFNATLGFANHWWKEVLTAMEVEFIDSTHFPHFVSVPKGVISRGGKTKTSPLQAFRRLDDGEFSSEVVQINSVSFWSDINSSIWVEPLVKLLTDDFDDDATITNIQVFREDLIYEGENT